MKSGVAALFAATGLLAGCMTADGQGGKKPPVPEEVAELAAPYQDLTTARLVPEDGCYWYEHAGPVERTMLPLLSTRSRPICVAKK